MADMTSDCSDCRPERISYSMSSGVVLDSQLDESVLGR